MAAQLISLFDTWKPGYDGATVTVYIAGTTTLASLFSDEGLTTPISNPQILQSRSDDAGITYGKFAQHVYTTSPYFLEIDIGENTGVHRPSLTSLQGQDASTATVVATGSSVSNTLAAIASRVVYAQNYGTLQAGGSGGSAATNTTTVESAIGALGSGGIVVLPAGLYRANSISLPAGVVLEGQGEDATTLQIINGDMAVILTGDKDGFRNMTLDGNSLTADSIGVYALNRTATIFENFSIKNFDKGMTCKGAKLPQFTNFSILNCNRGGELHGDMDAGDTNLGGSFRGGQWIGGTVYGCTDVGLDLAYIDQVVAHHGIQNVDFNSNSGTAVKITGAQFEVFNNCQWTGNAINLDVSDEPTVLTPNTQYQNKAISIHCVDGLMSGGTVQITGNADDIMLERMKLLGVTFNLVDPVNNNVILKDCFEDSGTVVTGDASRLVRQFGREEFEVTGITTDNVSTRAFGVTLENNELAYFEVKAIGVQRNGTNRGIYHVVCGGRRAPGTLLYQSQTANFTLGDVLTGATSGATARIVADSDSGTTGTLSLEDVQGEFASGEIVTGSTTGSANVNGTLADGTHSADSVGIEHVRTAYETDSAWDVAFTFSAGEIGFAVLGNSSQTIDWTINAKVVVN